MPPRKPSNHAPSPIPVRLRRFLSRYGLRIQVIGMMTVTGLVIVAALGAVWLRLMERNFIQVKHITGANIHASLQSLVALEWEGRSKLILGTADQSRLTDVISTFANYHPLKEIFILDAQRTVVADRRPDRLGQTFTDADVEEALRTRMTVDRYRAAGESGGVRPDDVVQVTAPIFLDKSVGGVLRMELPMAEMADAIIATRRMLVWYAVITVLVTVMIGSLALMRLIVRPVAELSRATARITDGDYDHKVPVRSENEIGLLARALANLHLTLRDRDRKLAEQRETLVSAARRIKRAEDEVIQQDRLAYLGRVTAGVAHEVGNPLAAVNNYLGVLSASETLADEDAEIIERVQHEVDRVDRIMRELLDFSRQRRGEPKETDLPAFLRECVGVLRDQRQIDRVNVDVTVNAQPPPLRLDRGQIKQVLFNALLNARDAVHPGEGDGDVEARIEVRLATTAYDDQVLLESVLPAPSEPDGAAFTDLARRGIAFSARPAFRSGEELALIHVVDEGPGLDGESVQRVFEPFFTTKTPGKGTGLGLAICQRIIENYGGVLRFESRAAARGRPTGSALSIVLPVRFEPKAEDPREDILSILGEG